MFCTFETSISKHHHQRLFVQARELHSQGQSTAPWWTPTFTSKSSEKPFPTLTAVLASTYVYITVLINHSSTPSFRKAHFTTSLGTLSKAFSKSTKPKYSFLFLPIYFSCSCLMMNIYDENLTIRII